VSVLLVLDVGTTTLRAAIVDERLDIVHVESRSVPPSSPSPGLVEFDPAALAIDALDAIGAVLARSTERPVAIGIANQRASTVVWDRTTGHAIGPGLGWQDLRTVFACIAARTDQGLTLAPNQSATKVAWLLDNVAGARDRDVCFGTVDSWLAWTLSRGSLHVTDHTNAAVTGLLARDHSGWSDQIADALRVPTSILPHIVSSSGVIGEATAVAGAPPIAALVGDQQGSLVGQGCVLAGLTKITFGTGGMLDMCLGDEPPASAKRSANGTFPIIAWSRDGVLTWGLEAIMLSAGSNVEWLGDDLGLIENAAASHDLAATVSSSDGVSFVPALLGLGTPHWDYGARGTLLGVTRGTTSAHVVRAVLDGVAQRGVDLIDAAVADAGASPAAIRIDGGMSANPTFVQALADLADRPIEVSPVADATTRGAAFLAGLGVGIWDDVSQAATLWSPSRTVLPTTDRRADRRRWAESIARSLAWIPELSALDF
jgi:glycerol kinase